MNRQTLKIALLFVASGLVSACGGDGGTSASCSPKPAITTSPPTQAIAGQRYQYYARSRYVCLIAVCSGVVPIRLPSGATFDDLLDAIYWTPGVAQIGTSVKFEIASRRDTCGDRAEQSWKVRVVKDMPPSKPANLSASENASQGIDLQWSAASDDVGVVGYKIYQNGTYLDSVNGLSATVARPAPDNEHCYSVTAFDVAGNESPRSRESCLSMPSDLSVPTAPSVVSAEYIERAGEIGIEVGWSGATDDYAISYYKVYRDNGFIGETAGKLYTDESLELETEYCYTVITVDAAGKESVPSDEECETTSWSSTLVPIDLHSFPSRPSLVIDSMDKLTIAYKLRDYDVTTRTNSFRLVRNTRGTGQWSYPGTIDSNPGTETGGVGIDVDDSNYLHIAYQRFRALTYANNLSGRWAQEAAGPESSNYQSISLGVGTDNAIHVCHSDFRQLVYSTNSSGAWAYENITAPNSTSDFVSCNLMLDSNNDIHLGYIDRTLKQLIYATNETGAWVTEAVAGYADTVHEISATIDSAGKIHIVYEDVSGPGLVYASNISGAWVVENLAMKAGAGWGSDIAVDQAGAIHISYRDSTNDKLKYATNQAGDWQSYTIDDALGATAIAIDSSGKIHIVHSGRYFFSIMHSTNRSYD